VACPRDLFLGLYYSLYILMTSWKPPTLILFYMLMISTCIFREKNTKTCSQVVKDIRGECSFQCYKWSFCCIRLKAINKKDDYTVIFIYTACYLIGLCHLTANLLHLFPDHSERKLWNWKTTSVCRKFHLDFFQLLADICSYECYELALN